MEAVRSRRRNRSPAKSRLVPRRGEAPAHDADRTSRIWRNRTVTTDSVAGTRCVLLSGLYHAEQNSRSPNTCAA